MNTIEAVGAFHRAFDCLTEHAPTIGGADETSDELVWAAHELMRIRRSLRTHASQDIRAQRIALIVEELAELAEALAARDRTGTLDALVDLRYVCDGGVLNFGMAAVFAEAFDRVHQSNMSKLGADGRPIHDAAGKVVKGPAYTPPRMADLVQR